MQCDERAGRSQRAVAPQGQIGTGPLLAVLDPADIAFGVIDARRECGQRQSGGQPPPAQLYAEFPGTVAGIPLTHRRKRGFIGRWLTRAWRPDRGGACAAPSPITGTISTSAATTSCVRTAAAGPTSTW